MTNLTKDELSIVYLDCLGVTRKRLYNLITQNNSVYNALTSLTEDTKALIGEEKLKKFKSRPLDEALDKLSKYLEKIEVNASTIISEDYPESLKNIDPMPNVLYYKGDFSLTASNHIIGVVGTRKPSNYGRDATKIFVRDLVRIGGMVTVSGLAYGIDSECAKVTIENAGKTIAVLGGGLTQIYPASNTELAKNIIKCGGLVLSEYFPSVRPSVYTFPDRNRIISGLSEGLLVIEAGAKSGSLITANLAIDQGKALFVVPANIDNSSGAGSNKLIEDYPETFTISPTTILNSLHISYQAVENVEMKYTKDEKRVVDALSSGEKNMDELCEILVEDVKTLNLLLTDMELSGIIKRVAGDFYSLEK